MAGEPGAKISGAGADHDRIDVLRAQLRVVERASRRFGRERRCVREIASMQRVRIDAETSSGVERERASIPLSLPSTVSAITCDRHQALNQAEDLNASQHSPLVATRWIAVPSQSRTLKLLIVAGRNAIRGGHYQG
jgi:hypothetical protein